MAAVPNETVKGELEHLLVNALASTDYEHTDQLYHLIVDKTNQLRLQYGLPARAVERDLEPVLKTTKEQLHVHGVASELVLGQAVFALATADHSASKPGDLCMFDQCFTSAELSDKYRVLVSTIINQHMKHVPNVMMYPPLLLRSDVENVFVMHVDPHTSKVGYADATHKANFIIAMFPHGPIIPAVDQTIHSGFVALMTHLYGAQGHTDAKGLERLILSQRTKV